MKVSLRWIEEFVDLPTRDTDELATALSNLGLEVEGWERIEPGFSGVVVARTVGIEPHPDADRIRLATVDTGAKGEIRVVCGAWNFGEGDLVAYATVGSVLAGGLEVGEREIRGVMSPGMIASEAELGIGEDADGILVLEDGEVGDDFAAALAYPDVVFDLSITPNRPDAMSVYGVARDLAALYDLDLKHLDPVVEEAGQPSGATVRIEAPDACHRFTARELRSVQVAKSPLWMRLRLRDADIRPINNVVDITNYVMLEYGQPLHAFDLDKIPEEQIVVRKAQAGESLRTLDGVDRELSPDDLVIAGPRHPIGLAGIMGGEETEVSDATERVLLEVAHFDPPGILLTGKRFGLRSEAVSRFERGVDPMLPPVASARATELMVQLANGEAAPGFVDQYPTQWSAPEVDLRSGEAERLLGVAIAPSVAADYLQRLGFEVRGDEDLTVKPPSYRPDVTRPADLVEEIARIHGYDKIPSRLPFGQGGLVPDWLRRERLLRSFFVGAGYFEVWNYDFVNVDDLAALRLPDGDDRLDMVEIRNPLSEDQTYLRTTLIPGLLKGIATNQARNLADAAIFEIGTVFFKQDGPLPSQPGRVSFAAAGRVSPHDAEDLRMRGARDAAGLVSALYRALGREIGFQQDSIPGYHPGRAASVLLDGEIVGAVGEAHPEVAERFSIAGPVAIGELELDSLVARRGDFTVPSAFPPVVFDLAFDLPGAAPAGDLLQAVRESAGPYLEEVVVFDVFEGPPLTEGRKSIALRLTFRHPERTLVEDELVPVRDEIMTLVANELDGRLRGG